MTKLSAGLLMCRIADSIGLQYFLVHPGGPFFKNKSAGYWSIPKGLPEGEEERGEQGGRQGEPALHFAMGDEAHRPAAEGHGVHLRRPRAAPDHRDPP